MITKSHTSRSTRNR